MDATRLEDQELVAIKSFVKQTALRGTTTILIPGDHPPKGMADPEPVFSFPNGFPSRGVEPLPVSLIVETNLLLLASRPLSQKTR